MRRSSRVRSALIVLLGSSALCVLPIGCSFTARLTDQERYKIDPLLQRVLAGETVPELEEHSSLRPDGEREYPAIVHSSKPEDVLAIGIHVQGRVGDILTVRVSVAEIEALARLQSVIAIRAGSRNLPNPNHN